MKNNPTSKNKPRLEFKKVRAIGRGRKREDTPMVWEVINKNKEKGRPVLTVEQADKLEDFNTRLQDLVLDALFNEGLEPWMLIAVLTKENYNLNRTGETMQNGRK